MRRATAHLKDEPAKPPVAKAADAALDTDSMWPADTPLVYLAIGAYSWGADEEDPGCTINAQLAARQGLIVGASLSTADSRAHAQILAPAALPEAISSAAVWQMRHLVDAAARDGTDILLNLLSNPDGIHIAIESDSWEGHMLVRAELREPNYVWSMAQNVASYAKARGGAHHYADDQAEPALNGQGQVARKRNPAFWIHQATPLDVTATFRLHSCAPCIDGSTSSTYQVSLSV